MTIIKERNGVRKEVMLMPVHKNPKLTKAAKGLRDPKTPKKLKTKYAKILEEHKERAH